MSLSPEVAAVINHLHETGTEFTQENSHNRNAPAPTFLIDGPSGSGKTTMTTVIEQHWNSAVKLQVIHMDDLYPGWDGLEEASSHVLDMLTIRAQGEDAHWQRYDWHTQQLAEWHSVDSREPLLIEGCGSLPLGVDLFSQARIWLDAPQHIRKERALSRGGEDFDAHWDYWEELFAEYVHTNNPEASATKKLFLKPDTLDI